MAWCLWLRVVGSKPLYGYFFSSSGFYQMLCFLLSSRGRETNERLHSVTWAAQERSSALVQAAERREMQRTTSLCSSPRRASGGFPLPPELLFACSGAASSPLPRAPGLLFLCGRYGFFCGVPFFPVDFMVLPLLHLGFFAFDAYQLLSRCFDPMGMLTGLEQAYP